MRGGRISALAAPYGGKGEAARRPEPWWKEYPNSSVLLVEIEGVTTADTSFERLLRENGREVFDVSVRRAYRYGCFDSERQALELRRMYVRCGALNTAALEACLQTLFPRPFLNE